MCDAAHALNLTCGWYGNNCGCSDHCTDLSCFAGDINAAIAFGFDSWKLDGCGREESIELFYTMSKWATTKAGRKPFLFENCHNGPNEPTRVPDWQVCARGRRAGGRGAKLASRRMRARDHARSPSIFTARARTSRPSSAPSWQT